MKILLVICMMLFAPALLADEMPAQSKSTPIKGEVLEVINVQSFTYLRLNTANGEMWAAVVKTPVVKGSTVTIEDAIVMNNFESKALKRTFPMILFGKLGAAQSGGAPAVMGSAYLALPQKWNKGDKPVAKAQGDNAYTVAEIVRQRLELDGKTVLLRGKVVKYNAGIMGKNWAHVRDGSGKAADNSNDILVTTAHPLKLGEVETFQGVVRIDQDFGAGYAYQVLVENATLQAR